MTHLEPTSIDDNVSDKADILGFCVADISSEALRSQVDRATEHFGHILMPQQLTFIKDMVALLVDSDPFLAQFASRIVRSGKGIGVEPMASGSTPTHQCSHFVLFGLPPKTVRAPSGEVYSDPIEFSNRNFYESRLQAIPAHPSNRAVLPPLRLTPVNRVYNRRRVNPKEAQEVVRIVKELLSQASPPSIGVACFNLAQRDEIVEALDRAAGEDTDFGARLAAARFRKGEASFEGLFVRNLESVQGDERDHMIISTTYGPDPQRRFYRRFGPLGQAGGGRRLNVLVTRARSMIHLVTSIPPEVYRKQAGSTTSGADRAKTVELAASHHASTNQHSHSAVATEGDESQSAPATCSISPRQARCWMPNGRRVGSRICRVPVVCTSCRLSDYVNSHTRWSWSHPCCTPSE